MAGRGRIAEQDKRPHPRVLTLSKDLQWKPAVAPLHFDKPGIVGVGIGRAFGRGVAEANPDITVGLIPCGVGGSPIDSWVEGAFYKPTRSHPWDDAIKRARRALQSGELKGILWHQGESDSKPGLAETYEKKLHHLIAQLRTELDAKNVPFIAGQMGQFAPWSKAKKVVDQAQRDLVGKVRNTAFVRSDGLKHKGDRVHFDAAGFRELGRRYVRAWLELTGAKGAIIDNPKLPFTVERTVASRGFDGKFCWVHARAGTVPPRSAGNDSSNPLVVMTLQRLKLSGSDVFYALNETRTDNLAKSWTKPVRHETFARQKVDDRIEMTVCDFWPKWHAASGRLLGTGHTVVYRDNKVKRVRARATPYSIYDPNQHQWSPWQVLEIPDLPRFENAGAGCVQRFDLPNGGILLPIYFKEPGQTRYSVTVLRCKFDGEALTYVEHGSELIVPVKRGLYEPSVTGFGGKFYLTMRNDDHGYISISNDGLIYSQPKKWTFDDGSDLGNYNTQQHWVTHAKGLFLVYTRRGAGNDHVFRHRAPLFIAQVDPDRLHVVRATEQILVPENGARLGNFGVTEVSPNETWVTVTEWMQTLGPKYHDVSIPMSYGSDNRVWVAKLRWK